MEKEDNNLSDIILKAFDRIIENQDYKENLYKAFINLDKAEFIKIFEENYLKAIIRTQGRVDTDEKIKIDLLKELLDFYLNKLTYQNNGMEIHHSHTYMKILSPYIQPPVFLLMLWRSKRSFMVENILDKEHIEVSPEFFDRCMKVFSQADNYEFDDKLQYFVSQKSSQINEDEFSNKFYQKDEFFKILFKYKLEKELESKTHKVKNKI